MSTYEKPSFPETECSKNFETFAGTIINEKKNLERNHERKIGGNDQWNNNGSSENETDNSKYEETSFVVPQRGAEKDENEQKEVEVEENKLGNGNSKSENETAASNEKLEDELRGTELKPRKNNVETGYLTKNPKIVIGSRPNQQDEEIKPKNEDADRRVKISSMEEEALRERTRTTLLKQCSVYLAADGSSRYTRETFRRVFTEKVRTFLIMRCNLQYINIYICMDRGLR